MLFKSIWHYFYAVWLPFPLGVSFSRNYSVFLNLYINSLKPDDKQYLYFRDKQDICLFYNGTSTQNPASVSYKTKCLLFLLKFIGSHQIHLSFLYERNDPIINNSLFILSNNNWKVTLFYPSILTTTILASYFWWFS